MNRNLKKTTNSKHNDKTIENIHYNNVYDLFGGSEYVLDNIKIIRAAAKRLRITKDVLSGRDRKFLTDLSHMALSQRRLVEEFAAVVADPLNAEAMQGISPAEAIAAWRQVVETIRRRRSSSKESFGEVARLPLPERAPALWAEAKEPGDTPPAFIQRHYEPWLGQGLTRAVVRRLDPQLYMALSNWLRKNDLPEGFDLPTVKEENDRQVESVWAGTTLPRDPVALHRLGAVMRRRAQAKS